MAKLIIYQAFVRHFSLKAGKNIFNGSITENLCGKFNSFNDRALSEIKRLGCTHIWFTGVIDHASQTAYPMLKIGSDSPAIVKGLAGSPYAIRDYYNVSADLAENPSERMQEFESLIDRTHKNGIKAIIDFVPNHVSRAYCSVSKPNNIDDLGVSDDKNRFFSAQNNFYYLINQKFKSPLSSSSYEEYPAKATGNDCFVASPSVGDWYDTIKINYGIDYSSDNSQFFEPMPNTWIKMKNILMFWASKGVDGFRCDMAEMVPVEFWNYAIKEIKNRYPKIIFIAEIYNPTIYHQYLNFGIFDFLYDKVGLYDTIRDVILGHLPAKNISFCWQNIDGIQANMVNFLENHDEQRIASDFFAKDPQRAIPALIVAATMNTNPFMLYAGQELGEKGMDNSGFSGIDGRSSIFDYYQPKTLEKWINAGKYNITNLTLEAKKIRAIYKKILMLCNSQTAISHGLFYDLTYANIENALFNSEKCFAFLRKHDDNILLCVANFSDRIEKLQINIPPHAFDLLQIGEKGNLQVEELISGNKNILVNISKSTTLDISVEAFSGVILKL